MANAAFFRRRAERSAPDDAGGRNSPTPQLQEKLTCTHRWCKRPRARYRL